MRGFIMINLKMRGFIAAFGVVLVMAILVWIGFYNPPVSANAVYPSIESMTPLNNDPKNLDNLQLKVKFSQPMQRQSVEDGTVLILSGVWDIPFTARWEDNSTVLLRPAGPLESHRPLTIIISREVSSVDGKKLKGQYSRSIVTGLTNPTVRSTEPENNSKSHPADGRIKIFFSQAMDQWATERSFCLRPEGGGNGVRGSVSWNENSTCFTFTPDNTLENGSWYLCTISTAARDIFNQKMTVNYTFRFLSSPM
jgi:hypothetical protein